MKQTLADYEYGAGLMRPRSLRPRSQSHDLVQRQQSLQVAEQSL